jgi:hypothetical protein
MTAFMINKKNLLFVATMYLLGAADLCSCRSTRTRKNFSPFLSKRIQQQREYDNSSECIAFFHTQSQQLQPQQQQIGQVAPLTPMTGWINDIRNAILDDFAATTKDSSNEILHQCVVNYRKGLVGNF